MRPVARPVRTFEVLRGQRVRTAGLLHFDAARPYEVVLSLRDADGEQQWRFLRDLLADSNSRTLGRGNVQIGPVFAAGEAWRRLRLATLDDPMTVDLAEGGVEAFLGDTFRQVPRGAEALHFAPRLSDDAIRTWLEQAA